MAFKWGPISKVRIPKLWPPSLLVRRVPSSSCLSSMTAVESEFLALRSNCISTFRLDRRRRRRVNSLCSEALTQYCHATLVRPPHPFFPLPSLESGDAPL